MQHVRPRLKSWRTAGALIASATAVAGTLYFNTAHPGTQTNIRPAADDGTNAAQCVPDPNTPGQCIWPSPAPPAPTVDVGSNDYPWDGFPVYYSNGEKDRYDDTTDPNKPIYADGWGMGYGQCVSFVAWKIYEQHGGTQRPSKIPAAGWFPTDGTTLSPITNSWGNAGEWNATAHEQVNGGFNVDNTPHVGAVAQWTNGSNDGWFTVGHVAMVTKVYPDGSIDIAGYNMRVDTGYSTLHLTPGQGGTDTTADHPADPNDPYHTSSFVDFHVTWPDHFIHIYDGS